MRRLAVINQKGGVGKTTTAANLGSAMGAAGRRVLLVDLDPQAHLTMCYGIEPGQGGEDKPNIYDVLTDSVPLGQAIVNVRPNVDIVPAYIDLAGAETELVNAVGREVILRDAISAVSESYDIALIDCPPSLGLLTINALVASEEVLIPLQAHFLALQGLSKLLDTVTLVKRRITPIIRISGIVFCMFDGGTRLASEVVEDVQQFLGASRNTDCAWSDARIYSTRIRRNIKLAESPSYGQTVHDYAPTSNGAADYNSLAGEIMAEWFGDQSAPESADVVGEVQDEGSMPAGDVVTPLEAVTTVEAADSPANPTEQAETTVLKTPRPAATTRTASTS